MTDSKSKGWDTDLDRAKIRLFALETRLKGRVHISQKDYILIKQLRKEIAIAEKLNKEYGKNNEDRII